MVLHTWLASQSLYNRCPHTMSRAIITKFFGAWPDNHSWEPKTRELQLACHSHDAGLAATGN